MTIDALAWASNQNPRTPLAKLILLQMADGCDEENQSFLTVEDISSFCQASEEEVRETIVKLIKDDLLDFDRKEHPFYDYIVDTFILNVKG